MVATNARQVITVEEFRALPDDGQSYELSRGMLICVAPSAYMPSSVSGRLLVRVGVFVDEHRLGEYGSAEGGFLLRTDPDSVRAPDAWFVRADRVPSGDAAEEYFQGPPDLAIEVLSPSDRFDTVMLKVRDYLDAGTALLWVFDPRSRLTAIFRPGQTVRFLDEDGVLDGEDVLPGFTLALRDVFR